MSKYLNKLMISVAMLPMIGVADAVEVSNGEALIEAYKNGENEIVLTDTVNMATGFSSLSGEVSIDGKGNGIVGNDNAGFKVNSDGKLSLKDLGNAYTVSEIDPESGTYFKFVDKDGKEKFAVVGKGVTGLKVNYYMKWGQVYNEGELDVNGGTYYGGQSNMRGGAITNNGVLNVENANFIGNKANSYGGAVSNEKEAKNISGTFIANSAKTDGGAVYNTGNVEKISGGFYSNTSAGGGAIYNSGTIGTIDGEFSGNSSSSNGGAIYNISGSTVEEVSGKFEKNHSTNGGAIANRGTVNIVGAEFNDNTATTRGGAIVLAGAATISGSTFRGNSARSAGAIWHQGNTVIEDSLFEDNKASMYGGAIYAKEANLKVINSTFKNNQGYYGGAIWGEQDLTIEADNGISLFSGNKIVTENETVSNAIVMDSQKTLALSAVNNGKIIIDDGLMDIREGGGGNYNIKLIGDESGEINLNGLIENANIISGDDTATAALVATSASGVTTNIKASALADGSNSLTMNSGVVNLRALGLNEVKFKELALNGGEFNVYDVGVDLEAQKMGSLAADSVSGAGASVTVQSLDIQTDSAAPETTVAFASDNLLAGQIGSKVSESAGPVYNYNVGYDEASGNFVFKQNGYNPQVTESAIAAAAAVAVASDEIYSRVLADADRSTKRKSLEEMSGTAWVKPFYADDMLDIDGYGSADAKFNGIIAGANTPVRVSENGVASVYKVYGAYADGETEFSDLDVDQDVWYLGVGADYAKGNVFAGVTANIGTAKREGTDAGVKRDFDSYLGGVAAKVGYDFAYKGFNIQPSLYGSYTYIDSDNYRTAREAEVKFGGISVIEIAPGLKVEKVFENELRAYAKGRYVHTFKGSQDIEANGIELKDVELKPYVEYGLGVEHGTEKVLAFAELLRRDGGREGWNALLGFNFNF